MRNQLETKLVSDLWGIEAQLTSLAGGKVVDAGRVVLAFTFIRRIELLFEPYRKPVQEELAKRGQQSGDIDVYLSRKAKTPFFCKSIWTLEGLLADPRYVHENLLDYFHGFSAEPTSVLVGLKFEESVQELNSNNLLFKVIQHFSSIDLTPETVNDASMGRVFDALVSQFSEAANERAGKHFTPRDVVELMVACLFAGDEASLSRPGAIISLYDPAVGTAGLPLYAAQNISNLNKSASVHVFGCETDAATYAIGKASLLMKGLKSDNILFASSISGNKHNATEFDYVLLDPPFGESWALEEPAVLREIEVGPTGRFGWGKPPKDDSSALFVADVAKKIGVAKKGARAVLLTSGSMLFAGDAGQGLSELRRSLLESDLVEAIIALPNGVFYKSGVQAYLWVLSSRKVQERSGAVQLVDASGMFDTLPKPIRKKKRVISSKHVNEIVSIYRAGHGGAISKTLSNDSFGYRKVTVDRPPQPGKDVTVTPKKGQKSYAPDLRDTENIPLTEDIDAYLEREVRPHVLDAFVNTDIVDKKDKKVGKVGYEISFNRYFYVYKPPRKPHIIAEEIRKMEKRFVELMKEVLV